MPLCYLTTDLWGLETKEHNTQDNIQAWQFQTLSNRKFTKCIYVSHYANENFQLARERV